ncbi:MAG: hypothetical protein KAI22_03665, partial [Gammaproteobacteria bacterium]|nr:hypothetical protein [Gammaproteobacteria bacterium]
MKLTLNHQRQKGVSLVAAIFVMVALAAIGVAMVTLSSVTSTTSALNIEQTRAYYAARSGMEWAISVVSSNDTNFNDSCSGVTGASWITIEGFAISVDSCIDLCPGCCNSLASCAVLPRVTTISMSAAKGSSGDIFYVKRQIQTT